MAIVKQRKFPEQIRRNNISLLRYIILSNQYHLATSIKDQKSLLKMTQITNTHSMFSSSASGPGEMALLFVLRYYDGAWQEEKILQLSKLFGGAWVDKQSLK